MREHYDFSKMKGQRNPYVKMLKRPVTIRLDRDTVTYFKTMSDKTGLPYQNLINLYLRDCALHRRVLSLKWERDPLRKIIGAARGGDPGIAEKHDDYLCDDRKKRVRTAAVIR